MALHVANSYSVPVQAGRKGRFEEIYFRSFRISSRSKVFTFKSTQFLLFWILVQKLNAS